MPLLRLLLFFILALGLQASMPQKGDLLQLKIPGGIAGFSKHNVYMVHGFSALRISFVGSSDVKPIKQDQKILYANLYKGIDLSYDVDKGLKSTYTIHPHANPSVIRLHYNAKVELDKNGDLLLSLPSKERLKVTKPIAWQMQKGKKLFKEVAFKTIDDHTVSFALKSYDPSKPLYIDPTYQWHTFYGDGAHEVDNVMAVDENGAIYLAGQLDGGFYVSTLGISQKSEIHRASGGNGALVMRFESNGSLDWYGFYGKDFKPATLQIDNSGVYVVGYSNYNWTVDGVAPKHSHSASDIYPDITILKLDQNGSYIWHAFYGGRRSERPASIVMDESTLYFTGLSYASWEVDGQAPKHDYNDSTDIFVLAIAKNDAHYKWHTFYGSDVSDRGYDITVDEDAVYVIGSSSKKWDVNGTAPLHDFNGTSDDVALIKLSKNGDYLWHSFYGSSRYDHGYGIAVDDSSIYLVGRSRESWDYNGTAPKNPFDTDYYTNAFILVLDKTDANYRWHTFYPLYFEDHFSCSYYKPISLDANNIYIGGKATESVDIAGHSPLHPFTGGEDLAVIKTSKAGDYRWHTYYGDSRSYAYGLAIYENSLYVNGYSLVGWDVNSTKPLHPHSPQNNAEITLLKLDTNGSYRWHTFYGIEGGYERGMSIAVDDQNNIYITGYSYDWRGPKGEYPLRPYNGQKDIFLLSLDENGSYRWHTFYGSRYDDYGEGIAVDESGIYVTGYSHESWDVNGTDPLHPYNDGYDFTILSLDKNGSYRWHTFYGSDDWDEAHAIAVDESGIYVTGYSEDSWDVNGTAPLHSHTLDADITILSLDKNGSYRWHTFYGSSDWDEAHAIAVDESGIYIAGRSGDSWDVNGTEPLHPYNDGSDITILSLDKNGSYRWHTFYGSSDWESAYAIAVDESGIYVTGYSDKSWDVNGTVPLHPHSSNNSSNIMILSLDRNGSYRWHTFYGSSVSEFGSRGKGLAINENGIYVTGYSDTSWDVNGTAPLHPFSGKDDITILSLEKNGSYRWHTFYGSSENEWGEAITLKDSNLYVTGFDNSHTSSWLGDNNATPLHRYIDNDLFVLKLRDAVNHPPVAADDNVTTPEDTPVTIDVLANDTDPDGDTLTIASVGTPSHGNAAIQGGKVLYTPNANYYGDDTFTYTISDGNGGSASATVHVTITPVNDNPVANDDIASTLQDTPVTIDVLANDSDIDGDTLTIASVGTPSHGSAAIQGGKVLYTPDTGFVGTDSFTYTVSDGHGGSATATVTVTVSHVNHPPVANDDSFTVIEEQSTILDVLANDSDPDGDDLVITQVTNPSHGTVVIVESGTKIQYTPEVGFFGASDSFTYTITDGHGHTSTATANVTVNVQEADGDNTKEDPNDDINHDGTKDYLQKNVSTPDSGTHKIGVAAPAGDALENVQKDETPQTITTEDGTRITLPYGTLSFKVHVAHNGDSAQITIYYPYNPAIQGYAKEINGVWKKVPSTVVHDQANHQTRVTFTLTDGGDFDLDASADGVITDPGGGYTLSHTVTVPLSPWAKLLMLLGFILLASLYKKELEA